MTILTAAESLDAEELEAFQAQLRTALRHLAQTVASTVPFSNGTDSDRVLSLSVAASQTRVLVPKKVKSAQLVSMEGPMMHLFSGRSIARLALAWTLIGTVPACLAQTTPNLDKHARKIHKKLAKYKTGSYLRVVLRDDTERDGALGSLTDSSFTVTNGENNTPETHAYSEVARVTRGKEYIGQGSAPAVIANHPIRLAIIGVLVAGAIVAAVEVR
jgi:hypothetical protein